MTAKAKTYKEIGDRLRAFRGTLGINQKDFAKKHNFSPTQYTNWETGERRIPPEKAMVLEERYGLTLDFIYIGRLRTLPHNLAEALYDNPSVNLNKNDSDTSQS